MTHPLDDLSCQLLGVKYGDLTPLQRSVVDLVVAREPSRQSPVLTADSRMFWDRMADRVAAVVGSWSFLFGFGAALAVWIAFNLGMATGGKAFDPYPFILLNLVLSSVAAFQAPVIMMSQNRQAAKDRLAAEHDYVVNLRAELEIMHLHAKVDRLLKMQAPA